jgi:hypothetical protein
MPTMAQEIPEKLRPFRFHGAEFGWREGQDEATGDCPFCGREGKWRINVKTGEWNCKVCQTGSSRGGGNGYTFIKCLHEFSMEAAQGDYEELAKSRGYLSAQSLKQWGVCQSVLTGEWIVPGYNQEGVINNLYRYMRLGDRMVLAATPTFKHGMFGVHLYDEDKPTVHLCEGIWDAIAWWEAMTFGKPDGEGKLVLTAPGGPASMIQKTNVLATPGANVFHDTWFRWFRGKEVELMFHSDRPREKNKVKFEPAGLVGMKRTANILAWAEEKPSKMRYLKWGKEGFDPNFKDGYDLRDHLKGDQKARLVRASEILGRLALIPENWLEGASAKDGHVGEIGMVYCTNWRDLIMAWRKALRWTEGLDRSLSVMLSAVVSTLAVGDQLWVKIIGPPSCGKSTLCEALSVNTKYIEAKSSIRGFHSGYKSDAQGEEDHSLITMIAGKTLITKDGDTLLTSPNLPQILSEARDLYDSTSRAHYRHGINRDYQGIRMTWILCGTSSLRQLDSSELGERFLDCVIMDQIPNDLEDEVLLRVANRMSENTSLESNGEFTGQHNPALVRAMQLTGGYVSYLRENAQKLLTAVKASDEALRACIALGKFVSFMRARPSKKQEESAEREFAARLTAQHVRLAKCLAAVLNKPEIDQEVMRRVTRVAMDTARGRTLELVKRLAEKGQAGAETKALALMTNQTEESERKLLKFLRKIGAVELFEPNNKGVKGRARWRLSDRLAGIYAEVTRNAAEFQTSLRVRSRGDITDPVP